MEHGQPSRTALRVAIRRAAHQLMEHPRVLDDPIAVPLVAGLHPRSRTRLPPVARDFRCFMAARSRYAEDQLAQAVAAASRSMLILGAGLDTFAYRNPFPSLRVFEVDFPATQEWKRCMLAEAAIPMPANLTFVPLDFEHKTLAEGLAEAGFDATQPAFFGWLGVVPYLTLEAFRATLDAIAELPAGSGRQLRLRLPARTRSPAAAASFRPALRARRRRRRALPPLLQPRGDRARTRAPPDSPRRAMDSARLNQLYFDGRADGLKPARSRPRRTCLRLDAEAFWPGVQVIDFETVQITDRRVRPLRYHKSCAALHFCCLAFVPALPSPAAAITRWARPPICLPTSRRLPSRLRHAAPRPTTLRPR